MYKTISPGMVGHSMCFTDAAESCSKAGFEGYWFSTEGDFDIPAGKTKELLAKTGLRAAGFGLPVEFRKETAVFESDYSKLENHVKYAAEIGAKRCVTWIMPFSDTLTYKENYELHSSRLKQCCEVLKEYDVVFGIEFVGPPKLRRGAKYEFIHNLDQALELCNDIGTGNCGLLMDVFHWDLAGQTKEDFKKITADQIALVHINDAPAGIPVEEQEDLVRKLPGETGVLRIADFFEGLKSVGYDGPVLAEPFEPKLAQMPYEKAFEVVIDSINRVWPK
jgi:sugar phosphate isomerase/epimerase